uniref:DEP domain-containing protein n=1 Tax=Strigamia maritima TaxID=126957 RepID=T1J2N4_STRMM
MKQFKLIVHHPNFSGEDLLINSKDFPSACIGDILEIYHPEDEEKMQSRLLLQITSLKDDFQQKDTISIKQSVATAFQLRTFAQVYVNIVQLRDVALDSIEITFKDQYLGRSDMWRLKKSVENTCGYLNKKIEFCGSRCEVFEMWAQGERVTCGGITEDTKIVFRSSTSQVYLFIQLSSEMWDMDMNGDLYFEKAVNGFLTDLFQKWKKNGSSHEVTIVLFSRTFYEAQSIEDFPAHMRDCLQQDYRGRFYEDFYRVAVQNEKYEDWTVVLFDLKRLFNSYHKSVLDYHKQTGMSIPTSVNSTAAQGNFLEVLNMSLNVFEKHYLDRSFDRTGQLSVVITPGVGVFEVDRELTNITKQRIIDNGVGSDLVCLGEQPLHAVPLFKFHNKNTMNAVDDYSMPHWINLSFYSSSKSSVNYSSFIPRIKLPQMKPKSQKESVKTTGLIARSKQTKNEDTTFPFVDYDTYDAQVFKLPTAHISGPHHTHSLQRIPSRKRSDQNPPFQTKQMPPYRKFSEADITLFQAELSSQNYSQSPAISIPIKLPESPVSGIGPQFTQKTSSTRVRHATTAVDDWEDELSPPLRTIVGSAGSPYSPQAYKAYLLRPGRALINPFDPSHVTIKLTSNRRRWTHVFPLGPKGIFMQQHHYQAIPQGTSNCEYELQNSFLSSSLGHEGMQTVTEVKRKRSFVIQRTSENEPDVKNGIDITSRPRISTRSGMMYACDGQTDRNHTLLWGATGEQEWTPALTTGVDWKSLTIPACLPLTTDYFPDRRSLQNDYLISDYTLLPEEVTLGIAQQTGGNVQPLATREVFDELVSQRLQQGFQQIVFQKQTLTVCQVTNSPQVSFVARSSLHQPEVESNKEYFLSIGRIFHKVSLSGSTITVTCYRPRHPYPTLNIHYQYRFQAPDMDNYEVSWVNFMSEKLETYNWNHLDHYVCWRGQGHFNLIESLKYWRFRVCLIPYHTNATNRQMTESEKYYGRTSLTPERETQMVDNFLRIIEVINKMKKKNVIKKTLKSSTFVKPPFLSRASHPMIQTLSLLQASSSSQLTNLRSTLHSTNFRERASSTRLAEKPRLNFVTATKSMDRTRSESSNGGFSSAGDLNTSSLSLDCGADSSALDTGDESFGSGTAIPYSPEIRKYSLTMPKIEIMEAMKQPSPHGLAFVSKQQGTPSTVFISGEAVAWFVESVEGAHFQDAMEFFESILSDGVICHVSGIHDHPFIYGFYVYYFVQNEKELDGEALQTSNELPAFQNEWLEVGVKTNFNCSTPNPISRRHSMISTMGASLLKKNSTFKKSIYKECNIGIDTNEKKMRNEWCHLRYHKDFTPGAAFEITINWMVATSSMLIELLQNWMRKANTLYFQMTPVPNDPFALPFSLKSDPLRGPIFIPMNMEFLNQNFCGVEQADEISKFQEKLADYFGFIPCVSEGDSCDNSNYYIHISGHMFLMIPTRTKELHGIRIPNQMSQYHLAAVVSSPHEEYITRHVMGTSGRRIYEENREKSKVGFLWSWNHMFTKRWKSPTIAASDEAMFNRTFKDFRALCSDKHQLQNLWDDWQQIDVNATCNIVVQCHFVNSPGEYRKYPKP